MTIQDYTLIISAAFTGALAHCAGMCGGIVIALNMKEIDSKLKQILANLLYFIGKACGYVCVGIIFTLIGVNLSLNSTASGIIFITLGILLAISATIFTFFPKGFRIITKSNRKHKSANSNTKNETRDFIKYTDESSKDNKDYFAKAKTLFAMAYKTSFSMVLKSDSFIKFFVIGILNGFLPCGLVYMFALQAAKTMNVLDSIIVMLLFSLGTFLPLFLVGMLSVRLLNSTRRKIFLWLCFAIMIYFSAQSIYTGYVQLSGNKDNIHHHH